MTTQNFAEKLAFLLHSEERAKSNLETHVYMVFQDGEICLTKCGNLLGQRSLHMVEAGVTNAIPSVFPNKMGENTYAYVGSKEERGYNIAPTGLKVRTIVNEPCNNGYRLQLTCYPS